MNLPPSDAERRRLRTSPTPYVSPPTANAGNFLVAARSGRIGYYIGILMLLKEMVMQR
jgi:hypothetical protein